MRFRDRMRLAALRGREQVLHRRIAQGYAKGRYLADARREQNEVRAEIRKMEEQG